MSGVNKTRLRLSIVIATLNRADFIGETLDSIICQLSPETELVVVDGASTDGTDRVVRERFSGHGNCRYHRLEKKGGIDQDYDFAVTIAKGDFVWLMTDDDIVNAGAIASLLTYLNDDIDLAVLNAEVASPDLTSILVSRKMALDSDLRFSARELPRLMETCGDLLSFIGSVVIRRSEWIGREKTKYFGTEFVHVGVIFQQDFRRSTIAIASPQIRIRYGNAMWVDRGAHIWLFKWPELIWSFDSLPENSRRSVVHRFPWQQLSVLLAMKARGWFSSAVYKRLFSDLKLGWFLRLQLFLIAYFPDVAFNFFACMFFETIFRREKGIHVDLRKSRFYYRRSFER
jgi:abequosyltransferase